MLLRTQPSGQRFDFAEKLLQGTYEEVSDAALKAMQRGIVAEAPFTAKEFERIQTLADTVVVKGFFSQLAALSLVNHREAALSILEGWKLALVVISSTEEYQKLTSLMEMIINADPVLGVPPFDKGNTALRGIIKVGLKQFLIVHESYIEEVVDYALSEESLDDAIGNDAYDENASQSYKQHLVLKFHQLISKNPIIVGNRTVASQMLVEVALSARLAVDIARKASKGHQVNFLNKLLGDTPVPEGDSMGQ